MQDQTSQRADMHWKGAGQREVANRFQNADVLAAYKPTVETAFALVINLADVSGVDRTHAAYLCLARAAGDLRVAWLLLQNGYTEQAANQCASLLEHSWLSTSLVESDDRSRIWSERDAADRMPWNVRDTVAHVVQGMISTETLKQGKAGLHELAVYVEYKFCCAFKHPSRESLEHSAGGANDAVLIPARFAAEHSGLKALLLKVSLTSLGKAVLHMFRRLADLDNPTCEAKQLLRDVQELLHGIESAWNTARGGLPFGLSERSLAQYRRARAQAAKDLGLDLKHFPEV